MFAIQVKFDNQWLYVCEGLLTELRVTLFNSVEDATNASKEWNPNSVRIVPYVE